MIPYTTLGTAFRVGRAPGERHPRGEMVLAEKIASDLMRMIWRKGTRMRWKVAEVEEEGYFRLAGGRCHQTHS